MRAPDGWPRGPFVRLRLAAEIAWTYRRVKQIFRHGDLPGTLAVVRDRVVEPTDGEPVAVEVAARLGRAVGRSLEALPTDSRCLTQSLVLIAMLARRRTPSRLVIGVRPGDDFGAHAWVEVDGRPVLPPGVGEFPRMTEL